MKSLRVDVLHRMRNGEFRGKPGYVMDYWDMNRQITGTEADRISAKLNRTGNDFDHMSNDDGDIWLRDIDEPNDYAVIADAVGRNMLPDPDGVGVCDGPDRVVVVVVTIR